MRQRLEVSGFYEENLHYFVLNISIIQSFYSKCVSSIHIQSILMQISKEYIP